MRTKALGLAAAVVALALPARAQSSAAFPDPPSGSRPPSAPAFQAAPSAPSFASEARPSPDAASDRSSWQSGPRESSAFATPTLGPAPLGPSGYSAAGGAPFAGPGMATPARDGGGQLSVEDGPATTPLVIGGIALGLPYATGLGIAAAEDFDNGSGWLAAPVAGPWLALSGRRDPCETVKDDTEMSSDVGKCVAEPMVRGMLVLDGVLQAAGAVLLIVGASSSETRIVRKEAQLVASPSPVGRDGYGLAMAGRF